MGRRIPSASRALAAQANSTPSASITTAPIGTSSSPTMPAAAMARADQSFVRRGAHRSRRSSTADNSAKPISRAIRPVARRRSRVGLGQDHAQHRVGQPDVGQHAHVALLERVAVLEILGGDVGIELLQRLGGDVVVQCGGGVGEQQPGAGGRGTDDQEELVVDIQGPNTAPALRSSRNSVSAADRLISAWALIGEQRQWRSREPPPRRSRTGVSAAPESGPADPGPRSARCPHGRIR